MKKMQMPTPVAQPEPKPYGAIALCLLAIALVVGLVGTSDLLPNCATLLNDTPMPASSTPCRHHGIETTWGEYYVDYIRDAIASSS